MTWLGVGIRLAPRLGSPPPPANDNILTADNGDFFTDDSGNLLENA